METTQIKIHDLDQIEKLVGTDFFLDTIHEGLTEDREWVFGQFMQKLASKGIYPKIDAEDFLEIGDGIENALNKIEIEEMQDKTPYYGFDPRDFTDR